MAETKLLSKHWDEADSYLLSGYERVGGYQQVKKALQMKPEDIVAEVTKSNLRGRGGAGFPTGLKWTFVRKEKATPKYLVINADEGEPGTFKDRYCLELDPHRFIEGCVIGAWALDCHAVYVYCRGEFQPGAITRLKGAIAEAKAKGYLGKSVFGSGYEVEMYVHRGAGAYICGEESALLESLEGKKGYPRIKPPFPANAGLFGKPTAVNNVETMSNIPTIIELGAEAYAKVGCDKNGGTRLFTVSGHVEKPGVYEAPMGTTFRELIYDLCGGIAGGRQLKAIIPGGSSSAVLSADQVDLKSDFDSLKAAKTMAGSGGVIVLDDTVDMAWALYNVTKFYAHESCGQCTPCREGTGWAARLLRKILDGNGAKSDIDLVYGIARQGEQRTICALFDGAAMPLKSYIEKFRGDFEKHVRN